MIIEHFWGQWLVFAFLSIPFVFCAWMAGHVQAAGWNSLRKAFFFATLIGLFHSLPWKHILMPDGWTKMTTLAGWSEFILTPIPAIIFFGVIAGVSFRRTQAFKMETQYPWLYRRTGPLTWTTVPGAD